MQGSFFNSKEFYIKAKLSDTDVRVRWDQGGETVKEMGNKLGQTARDGILEVEVEHCGTGLLYKISKIVARLEWGVTVKMSHNKQV